MFDTKNLTEQEAEEIIYEIANRFNFAICVVTPRDATRELCGEEDDEAHERILGQINELRLGKYLDDAMWNGAINAIEYIPLENA